VGIVVYGSTARALLEPTIATDRARIRAAIDDLAPEGSTYVEAGLELGYRMAASMPGAAHTKRLVLCSDGVANVGLTDGDAIVQAVRREAAQGVTLSAVGFGMGNYNDALMERLAQLGDGNYAYVDRESEARRVFVEQLTGTLEVMAADTKLQVELDPRYVLRYRLVGYENRMMAARDFRDDAKDAGEVGAGHAVTAIYELELAPEVPRDAQLGVVRIRYKAPGAPSSQELQRPISAALVRATLADASPAVRLSVAAAGFAEKLRGSYWARGWTYPALASVLAGLPPAWRTRADIAELASLVVRAEQLDRRGDRFEDEAPRARMGYDEVPVVAGR
jgi:Ca-activated chloride channel family protein